MNTNDLNTALYEKMAAEQDKYRDWLKSQPPAEVLNHAYEYTVREDIVMAMEELELTDAQAQALLDSPTPLADVYRHFEKLETGYMDVIRDSIENRADDACKAQAELRKAAIYPHSAAYAKEHGELEQYRASNNANLQCKEAIEAAVREPVSYTHLVRPGGVVAFVTSRYTMDAKDSTVRRYLAQRAELLGAIRLPNNAFKANAGTEVVSDIIFLQKRDRPLDIVPCLLYTSSWPRRISWTGFPPCSKSWWETIRSSRGPSICFLRPAKWWANAPAAVAMWRSCKRASSAKMRVVNSPSGKTTSGGPPRKNSPPKLW